ncbi:glycosyltransferase family 1 protein [Rugosimonospora acidiphila]|uniref:Glycosyltransferase family 1 protein n=1 Tax=Rugosimonospora acidiphila TaxID=556531 RepID=A0ABP9RQU7_9ACTN
MRLANFVAPRSGGLRTAMRALGSGYLAAGHEPVLVIPGERAADEMTDQGRLITLPGPVVPLSGGYRVLLNRRRLTSLLAELRPDRLEVSDRTTLRWTGAWARRNGVPSVMVSHESVAGLLGLAGRVLSGPAALLADALNSRTAMHYTSVVCTTDWAAAEFARLGVANLRRVPLGVDLNNFSPAAASLGVRRRYARDDEVLIVHCGRLSPEKRPERSVIAVQELREAGVPAVLVVAGDGPLRPRLVRRAAGLPVRFAGFVPDRAALAALLASADVVLAPGPVETFGLAALEALACGTPVVVSDQSALPEVIGAAGVAVRGEAFADGVRDVLNRPSAQRRAAARHRAQEFGWPNAVAGFLGVHGVSGGLDLSAGRDDSELAAGPDGLELAAGQDGRDLSGVADGPSAPAVAGAWDDGDELDGELAGIAS